MASSTAAEVPNNAGFAFVVNSLLRSNKNVKLLSKAKKETDLSIGPDENQKSSTKDSNYELIGEDGNVVKVVAKKKNEEAEEGGETKPKTKLRKAKLSKFNRRQVESIGRTKPSVTPADRDRERMLTTIATKGVVQLFNVVQTQQIELKRQIEDRSRNNSGGRAAKREKLLSQFNETKLFREINSTRVEVEQSKSGGNKRAASSSDDPKSTSMGKKKKWNVLSEDFMCGGKFKDWDKDSDDDEDNEDDDDDGNDSH